MALERTLPAREGWAMPLQGLGMGMPVRVVWALAMPVLGAWEPMAQALVGLAPMVRVRVLVTQVPVGWELTEPDRVA